MSENEAVERRFIAKVIYRLGGKKVTDVFVEAKSLGVRAEMFANPTCKVLWMAAEALFSEPDFEKISISAIVHKAKSIIKKSKDKGLQEANPSFEFLDESEKGVRGDDDIQAYYKELCRVWATRAVKEIRQKADDAIAAGEDAMLVYAQEQEEINHVINGGTAPEVSIREISDGIIRDYKDVYHHKVELGESDYRLGLSVGWKYTDEIMGGIENSMLVVAARTGIGKTSFAMALIRYWLKSGQKIVFNSLDMESRQAIIRQIAEGSGVSSRRMKKADIDPKYWNETIAKVESAAEELCRYEEEGRYKMLEIYDIDQLRSRIKILKKQGRVDVLVVDYIGLMECGGGRGGAMKTFERVSYVTTQLRKIANQERIVVVGLAQINRSAMQDDTEPEVHQIRDSGNIEQDASHIIILHPNRTLKKKWDENPPEQFLRDPSNREAARALMPMWVKIAKCRDGSPGINIPFVVLQSRYAWFEGDTSPGMRGDDCFLRVKSNPWKPDPMEKVWERNGSLINVEIQREIDRFNQMHQQTLD